MPTRHHERVPETRTVTTLRTFRERAGLSQAALAERIGLSRQAVVAIESGRQVPSTAVALLLARALGQSVEELFQLGPGSGSNVRLGPIPAWGPDRASDARPARVALARIGDDWVAHRLSADASDAADALLTEASTGTPDRLEFLADPSALERNVLVAGCAPLLGVLAQRVGRRHGEARGGTFLSANSERALTLLAGDYVHVGGMHLGAEGEGDDHVALVRERFPGREMLLVHLIRWRVGLAVAAGNPRDIRHEGDLIRPDVRFVAREAGAGTSALLRRRLAALGAALPSAATGVVATSHGAVAEIVRSGGADVGVTIESAALAAGLDFVPWLEERFDLVVPREHAALPSVARFLDTLADRAFRAEVGALPGYDGVHMGRVHTIGS
jgi:putative molybdopterin biosynthesis protein